ncbi:predicted protein [Plenodomus lingam JN3]|uniref:Uncharacterized protein n=1 Tax=Leptosphaeria maculans (strain JN3 / isolate v23.1.3 / race Av1-4-5-6-7-8) TaxID=985895 RepID=E4ZGE1_LEPMJ|nr:predicted protein [Plenodomus lingam JN3]CBX90361.1 predicted protein [Plenodomus lingam JN3]
MQPLHRRGSRLERRESQVQGLDSIAKKLLWREAASLWESQFLSISYQSRHRHCQSPWNVWAMLDLIIRDICTIAIPVVTCCGVDPRPGFRDGFWILSRWSIFLLMATVVIAHPAITITFIL